MDILLQWIMVVITLATTYAHVRLQMYTYTSYHPIANGLIERFQRHLKTSLKSYPNALNWTQSLPLVLLGIRTTIKSDFHCTMTELVYGTTFFMFTWQIFHPT